MESQRLQNYCHSSPDEFLKKSSVLKTLEPPDNFHMQGLSKEIWHKFNDNKQTIDEFRNKINLWKQLNKWIQNEYPDYGLFIAGSSVNGFGLKNSDIDFSYLSSTSKSRKVEESTLQLTKLYECIKKYDKVGNLKVIKANIPLVHFRDTIYDFDVDINYNGTANIRNSHLLLNYSLIDWRVRPVVTVIKLWAKYHNLIDAKYCSLSSYPLVLLVIHFLQCGVKPAVLQSLQTKFKSKFEDFGNIQNINFFTPTETHVIQKSPSNDQSLEDLLIGFFKYYQNFDFDKYVISIRRGDKIPLFEYLLEKLQLKSDEALSFVTDNTYMFIEEPFNLSNVGKTVRKKTAFEKIKNYFKSSYEKLEQEHKLSAIF